jgi:hypothetical protein
MGRGREQNWMGGFVVNLGSNPALGSNPLNCQFFEFKSFRLSVLWVQIH